MQIYFEANLIFKSESSALASLLRNSKDGLALPDSSLEITDCFVPIFRAKSFWVSFFLDLAPINALIKAYSGLSLSYSALILGSLSTSVFQAVKSRCFLLMV